MVSVILFNSHTPEWAWLSNFSPHPVGTFPTAEHAYQACKTLDPVLQDTIRRCVTPAGAKRLGREIHILRPNWERDKVHIMKRVLDRKCRQNRLREQLSDTGLATLIHYAPWGDTFWGVDKNHQGLNVQGKLLMELRDIYNQELVENWNW